jgi:hypothetical protein
VNRLRAQCFVVSTLTHLVLVLVLLAGSGFLASRRQPEVLPVLTFVPDRLVDAMVVGGGGNPRGNPQLPPAPIVRAPPALPAPRDSGRNVAAPKPKSAPKDLTGDLPGAKKSKVVPNLKLSTRSNEPAGRDKGRAETEAAERLRRAAQAYRQQVAGAVGSLERSLSGSGVSAVPFGPGGESYANYTLFVWSLYDQAWVAPEDIADEAATVRAKVVIVRDGRVLRSEIVSKSGIPALDQSVREALERVDNIGYSFPDGAKEEERIFFINFNLKAKRKLG